MTSYPKLSGVSILLSCFILCGNIHYSLSCTFHSGTYDLSALGRHTWPVVDLINGNKFVRYDISICSPLNYSHSPEKENCVNSSVCRRSDGNATSFGDYISNTEHAIYDNVVDNGFSMYFRSSSCLTTDDTLKTAVIHFICGEHLGSPKLVTQGKCNAYFWWETSAACKKPQRKEVPCYVIDSQGNKRDLTKLIQKKNGYMIQTDNPDIDFTINVCSSILRDQYHGNCLANSSACRIYGAQHLSFGEPKVGLQLGNNDVLTLTYTTENEKQNASDACVLPPKTTIFFRCPQNRQYQYPKVISQVDCQYEIEWNTQHACPEATIKGDFKECRFYNRTHGVDIDLSPLRNQEDTYSIAANVSGEKSIFSFNVCAGLGKTPCNGRSRLSDAVCITNSQNISTKAGSTIGATLLYVDGNILLSYERGEDCTHGKKHKTIISFICNNSAEHEGFGRPEHISSSDCLHLFKWDTKYACPKESYDTPCYAITDGKSVFDLSILRRNEDEELWLAVDEMFLDAKSDNASYFINVCGSVPQSGFFSGCGNKTSVCRIDDGKYLNLGAFVSPPTYNTKTKSVWLEYKDGSQCRKDKRWRSLIEFSCKPGQFTSPPVLMNINSDSCTYEFLWQSARACPVSTTLNGDFCRIRDSNLGIDFDLSLLKSEVHEVKTEKYSFSIGVCSSLTSSVCNSLLNTTTYRSIGACQYQESDNGMKSWVIGETNSHLSYSNGVVNLTYGFGDPYNDVDRTPRKTVLLFMCDFTAGLGNPIFIEEVKFTYIFHWYTNLVCTEKISAECTVYDTVEKQFYDLSSLSKSDSNWNLFFEDDDGNTIKAYINICRHLTPIANCGANAAVCLVNHSSDGMETSYIPNLGRAVNNLVFSGEGNLQLFYSHGQLCSSEQNVSYSTVIHFICSKNAEFGGPRLIGKVGDCQYAFLWATEAACPTGQVLVKDECSIIDPVTGFVFDLSSLKRENAYSISAGNRNFQINVCGPIRSGCHLPNIQADIGNISVCETDQEGNALSVLGTTDEYSLQYFRGSNHVILRYKNGSNSKKRLTSEVLINFRCDMSSTEVIPDFIKEEGNKYFFEIRTPLTCLTQNFVCEFVDSKGNEYDLSPLSRKFFENWNIEDTVSGQNTVRYLINFCRPLNRIGYIKNGDECPGGDTAACEKSSEGSFSLGSQYSTPNISENGVVTLLYTNGSPCANGLKRSTRINLICSYKQGNIVFVGKTPECEYIFSLHTPVACSLQTSKGHNCSVKDPIYGYDFNLNPLRNSSANFSVVSGDYVYYLNICDKLQGFSGVCKNSSVCQTKAKDSKFSKSLGIPNSEIYYSKGIISLTYLFGTEKCHKKYSRSTTIKFTCDHATSGMKAGPVFISETEDCTYLFEWATKYACPPFRVVDCVAEDSNGFLYDLSPLSLSNDNYYLKNPFHTNQTFVINICRSVVHSSDSVCPYESASCLLDSGNLDPSKRSLNLGEVSSSPFFENGTLKISYTSGDKCDSVKKSSTWFMETVIDFTCDKNKKFSEPEYVGRDDCIYYFTWATAFACPINTSTESTGNCSVNDPITDYGFDLSPLMSEVHLIKTANHVFSFNVCGALKNSSCSSKSGICQSELSGSRRSWNTGNSNANLLYHDGALFLNYSGGDSCHNNMFKRNSIIQFECGEGIGEPKFLSESFDCTYYFIWKTKFACQHLVHCGIKNGSHFFDLHTLAENLYHSAESELVNDNSLYYISVCNAFINLPNPLCPIGSSLCRVFSNGTAAESLGNVEYPPFVDFEGHATIIYTNGSPCSDKSSERNAARVIFQCDPTTYLGKPNLIDKPNDCLYIFEWKTSIVCPPDPSTLPKIACSYSDQSRGVSFDLTPLRRNGSYYEITDEQRRQNYRLNLCDSTYTKECGTSSVCQKGEIIESYGSASSISFSYDGERLRAIYTDGDDCLFSSNGKRTSEIIFVCDMNAGLGKPKLFKKYTCLVVFIWETNLVCKSTKHSCSFDVEGKHYDFHLLSSLSHNWKATDDQGNFYLLNLCRGLHSDGVNFHCPSTTAVCLTDNKGFSSSLGMISTMKANLTDTGELMLSYTLGSSHPCTLPPTGNSTLNATARIFLSCGNSLGTPVFRSGPKADCVFDFDWKTSLACEKKVVEMTIDNSSILIDKRFGFQMDLGDILNRTFHVPGHSNSDLYIYVMNLKLGYSVVGEDNDKKDCAIASVCQTKSDTTFRRDIGSLGSMKFQIRGTELHLLITSYTKPCGKNRSKNVTTLINMHCSSSAGIGSPSFFYESGNCDYIFNWETQAVCPQFYRPSNDSKDGNSTIYPIPYKTPDGNAADLSPNNEHQEENVESSNNAVKIVVTFIAVALIVFVIIFVFSSARRRSAVSLKCRSLFNHVHLPRFRYRRGGETLVLIDASEINHSEGSSDEHLLTL